MSLLKATGRIGQFKQATHTKRVKGAYRQMKRQAKRTAMRKSKVC
jgi:hypothetical protein